MMPETLRALAGMGPFIVLGLALVALLERRWPARRYDGYWRRAFWRDAGAFVVVAACSKLVDPALRWADAELAALVAGAWSAPLPVALKVAGCLVLGDLLQYWVHRAMHASRALWRTHRWHHAPKMLTALAGYRGSVLHRLLFGAAALLIPALVFDLREPVALSVLAAINVAHDLFIHANLDVRLGPLERVFATPRWHRVHHGLDRALSGSNFGARFTVWDRLFGTYRAPEDAPEGFELGIDEEPHPIAAAVGV